MLYREPKLLKVIGCAATDELPAVSVLYREPKLLKGVALACAVAERFRVSVLYREPKLLKVEARLLVIEWEQMFQCSTVSRNC